MNNRILGSKFRGAWFVAGMFACIGFLFPSTWAFAASTTSSAEVISASSVTATRTEGAYERAIVKSVQSSSRPHGTGVEQVEVYRVKFTGGPLVNQEREIANEIGSNPYGIQPREGDRVIVFIPSTGDDKQSMYIEGFDRTRAIALLVAVFVATLLVLAGKQGLYIALSIGISLLMIGMILIPAFLKGYPAVPVAIALAGIFTLISTGLTTGWNKKTFVTAIGTMGGALVAYVIALLFSDVMHLQGLSSEEDRMFFERNPLLSSRNLLFAGIIIASAGVVEDVAVSIASGVVEIKRANPGARFRELFRSGMTIGNDHMGALANTLVYAYVGGSLSLLLLYQQFGGSWVKFLNFDSVVDEILRSLAGTIGLIFTVPMTALLAAYVTAKMSEKEVQRQSVHTHHHHE